MFITGATSGFGEAVARMAAKAGYALALTGRRADRLEALQAELGDAVQHVLCFDVRDREGTAEAIQRCSVDFIPTVLVNNAGLAVGREPIDQGVYDDWDRMIDLSLIHISEPTRPY